MHLLSNKGCPPLRRRDVLESREYQRMLVPAAANFIDLDLPSLLSGLCQTSRDECAEPLERVIDVQPW